VARAIEQEDDGAWTDAEERAAVEIPALAGDNPVAIKREFEEFTRRRRQFRALRTRAFADVKYAERRLERAEARSRLSYKRILKPSGAGFVDKDGRKVTAEDIDAYVVTCDEVILAGDRLVEAQIRKERLDGVLEDASAKKEMLISLGAQVRTEMEGDPVIRSRRPS
jgi:hypothetical protein